MTRAMPEPDGYILLCFADDSIIRYDFKDIKSLDETVAGIVVRFENRCITYPWVRLHSVNNVHNSDEYVKQMRMYQAEHDHNWIEQGPVDIFGMDMAYTCGPDKLGKDPGCKATKIERLKREEVDG